MMQDALDVPAFSGSEEAQVAEGLVDAYRTGDDEAVRQFVASHPTFLELDNQVGSVPFACCEYLASCRASLICPCQAASSRLLYLQYEGMLHLPSVSLALAMQVVRLARKLPQGNVKVLAASLGTHQLSVGDDADEEDLT